MIRKLPSVVFLLGLTCTVLKVSSQAVNSKLDHIAMNVLNLKASVHFYQQIIKLDTIPEPFHDGKHAWLKMGNGSQLHLIQGKDPVINPGKYNHTCFSVTSFPGFISLLQQNHITYENWQGEKNAITKRADGVQQVYLQDPDGYWIEINDAK